MEIDKVTKGSVDMSLIKFGIDVYGHKIAASDAIIKKFIDAIIVEKIFMLEKEKSSRIVESFNILKNRPM